MASLPAWVSEMVEKGGSLSECLALLKQREISEREERAGQRELEKAKLETEVKIREIELREQELKSGGISGAVSGAGDRSNRVKCVLPKFVEGQDVDVFLTTFEKLAHLHGWKVEQWAVRLVPQLSGKALEAYARLSDSESSDYEVIKRAILKRYDLTAQAYRDKFRNAKQLPHENFREFSVRETGFWKHWCDSETVGTDFEKLEDLMLREQLMQSATNDLRIWLKERQPKTVKELVDLAEAYQTAHRSMSSNQRSHSDRESRFQGNATVDKGSGQGTDTIICFGCNRKGHIAKDCPLQLRYTKGQGHGAVTHTNNRYGAGNKGQTGNSCSLIHYHEAEILSGSTCSIDVPVVGPDEKVVTIEGSGLRLTEGKVNGQKVRVLRDTGSTTIFVGRKFCSDSIQEQGC